jgi:hypothetical protein
MDNLLNPQSTLLFILGIGLVITGILDGWKYHWLAVAIRKAGTAKGQSRKFVNAALLKDVWFLIYLALKPDWYIILMTFIGFVFTIELLITVYNFYPYRYRNLNNFKKPSFFTYFINSIISNKIRKRL